MRKSQEMLNPPRKTKMGLLQGRAEAGVQEEPQKARVAGSVSGTG